MQTLSLSFSTISSFFTEIAPPRQQSTTARAPSECAPGQIQETGSSKRSARFKKKKKTHRRLLALVAVSEKVAVVAAAPVAAASAAAATSAPAATATVV